MSSYQIEYQKIKCKDYSEWVYPAYIDNKLFNQFIEQSEQILNNLTIEIIFHSNATASIELDYFKKFILDFGDLVPKEVNRMLMINDNKITIGLFIYYMWYFSKKIESLSNWYTRECYEANQNIHKNLSLLMGRKEVTIEFSNWDINRLLNNLIENKQNEEVYNILQKIAEYHVNLTEQVISSQWLLSKWVDICSSKSHSFEHINQNLFSIIFHNLFLDKNLYIGILSDCIIDGYEVYSNVVIFDQETMSLLCGQWNSITVININPFLNNTIRSVWDSIELVSLKKDIQIVYQELINYDFEDINWDRSYEYLLKYIKSILSQFKKNKPMFQIQTTGAKISEVKTTIEEANPKEFHRTQLKLKTRKYQNIPRWNKDIRVIEKTITIEDIYKELR